MSLRRVITNFLFLFVGGTFCLASTLDSGLFTTYTTDTGKTTLNWVVCGSIGSGSDCYSFGTLGPFVQIGSILETARVYDVREGTVTRSLYVIDQAFGSSQNGVALYVYQRVDTIAASYEHTVFTLKKTISLPLVGGSQAVVYAAANNGYLVVGTNNSPTQVKVNKHTLAVTPLTLLSEIPTSISTDGYGYVVLTSVDSFGVLGPDGNLQEDGGGSDFTINDLQGTQP